MSSTHCFRIQFGFEWDRYIEVIMLINLDRFCSCRMSRPQSHAICHPRHSLNCLHFNRMGKHNGIFIDGNVAIVFGAFMNYHVRSISRRYQQLVLTFSGWHLIGMCFGFDSSFVICIMLGRQLQWDTGTGNLSQCQIRMSLEAHRGRPHPIGSFEILIRFPLDCAREAHWRHSNSNTFEWLTHQSNRSKSR